MVLTYIQLTWVQMYPLGRAIWWPRMVLTLVQLILGHVLLFTIDCLEFSRVLCNSPSSYFICNPVIPPDTPTPPVGHHPKYRHLVIKSGTTAGQHDMSSASRKMHLVEKSGTNWGLVHLNSCSIVCNILSWPFKRTLEYTVLNFHM